MKRGEEEGRQKDEKGMVKKENIGRNEGRKKEGKRSGKDRRGRTQFRKKRKLNKGK